jgi:hypothetical protein
MKNRIHILLLITACVFAVAGSGQAAGVQTGFIVDNPQIFPVGDLVDVETIESSDDFDWGSLPDMVFFEITADSPQEKDTLEAVFHLQLEFSGINLIDYWSSGFPIKNWINSPIGRNGYFTNTELGQLQESASDWLNENDLRSAYYAETEDFMSLLDGSNIRSGIAIVRIELYRHDGGDQIAELLSTHTQTTEIFNPSAPVLQEPEDRAVVNQLPLFLSWSWYGGMVNPNDMELIIVEGRAGEDGETVISSRTPANTRYEGPPQFTDSHTYTAVSGTEQALEDGKTYYWQVRIAAGTPIPGENRLYESNIYSFKYDTGSNQTVETGPEGLDPVMNQLQSVLPPEVMTTLSTELEGYTVSEIVVDGVGGYGPEELMQLLNPQSGEVYSVTIE